MLSGKLYASQLERSLLENMEVSRQTGPESKTITIPEIEDRLEQVVRVKGEARLNELRDKARTIAEKLNLKTEFEKSSIAADRVFYDCAARNKSRLKD